MIEFDFSKNVIDEICEELRKSGKFIKIAIFQLHAKNVFEVLTERLKKGVSVDIITLPYDSINPDVRNDVTKRFENLIADGANVYFNAWNVGDPQRTSTAVGRWYSFHGKFIVTDKVAIALSANFTNRNELDAYITYRNDSKKISDFKAKFNELYETFCDDTSKFSIKNKILIADTSSERLFKLPEVIESSTHKDKWIMQYPDSICNTKKSFENGIYFSPFDYKARNLYERLLNEATKYVYISTETFTDEDFADVLCKIKCNNKKIKIKVLTSMQSADFKERIERVFREMLASDIEVKTTSEALHAKLFITDKNLLITSVNLNKINLGFSITKKYWRGNMETVNIETDKEVISSAKNKFESIFNNSTSVEEELVKKVGKNVANIFSRYFELKSSTEVKSLFAKLIVKSEINTKKMALKLSRYAKQIVLKSNKKIVKKEEFLMALILFHLSERKHLEMELMEKVNEIDSGNNLNSLLSALEEYEYIEKENDYWKINVGKLI